MTKKEFIDAASFWCTYLQGLELVEVPEEYKLILKMRLREGADPSHGEQNKERILANATDLVPVGLLLEVEIL